MQRRRLLAAVPAAVALGAGCLGSDAAPALPVLDRLWFVNDSGEECAASVVVTDDGEQVYESSFRLGPATTDPDHPANLTLEPALGGPGEFVVRATVAGETVELDAVAWVDGEENCVVAKFVRSARGDLHARPDVYENC